MLRALDLICEGYGKVRAKRHGAGPAPRRQALMMGLLYAAIGCRWCRHRLWRWCYPKLLWVLYTG